MLSICRQLCRIRTASVLKECCRAFEGGPYAGSHIFPSANANYEGDGKTTVTQLGDDAGELILIDTFSNAGFRLNNSLFVVGPIAVFPKSVLQWNVESMETLTPEAFSLFELLEPKLDLLVIGCGDERVNLNENCVNYLRKNKIYFETLSTKDAIPVFNYLVVEGRNLAALLFPPDESELEAGDYYNRLVTMHRRGVLFRETTAVSRTTHKQDEEIVRSMEKDREKEELRRIISEIQKQSKDPNKDSK
ncbi:NADH dehydrogenase [ubiquinone] 1 alpha subcomplex assembly factor 3-like protein [Leptotrombidium deliense]|uniref:NADH dehydrogenase [ubiquinone] 1 alpha subcomplex assembly factor 3-like protein n=1 Tax=Leptotrombidium deliense TaxID=299467 RepID=A0A443SQ85_9ACAR|nr:NADH dehydrogenase [ubiquinone] 1 alpha subcomplex assembly factor 3-like protein [Leptotrombidium deliense]